MKNEASVEISAPIEDVFDYTTTKVAEWSSIVVEDEVIEEVAGGVGTRFRCVTEEHGKRMEFEGLVTVNDRPQGSYGGIGRGALRHRGGLFLRGSRLPEDSIDPEVPGHREGILQVDVVGDEPVAEQEGV